MEESIFLTKHKNLPFLGIPTFLKNNYLSIINLNLSYILINKPRISNKIL
jgi:hypothetical protein